MKMEGKYRDRLLTICNVGMTRNLPDNHAKFLREMKAAQELWDSLKQPLVITVKQWNYLTGLESEYRLYE